MSVKNIPNGVRDLYQCRQCRSFLRIQGMVKEDPGYGLPNPSGGVWNPCYYNCRCGKFLIHDPNDGGELTLSLDVRRVPYSGGSALYLYGKVDLMVCRGKNIKTLLSQDKHGSAVSLDINDGNFPPERWEDDVVVAKVEYRIFYLPQPMEFEKVALCLHQETCRGASLREGLVFCHERPGIHRKLSMYLPGSSWRDPTTAYKTRSIPHIGKTHDVFLRQLDQVYQPGTIFLAVAFKTKPMRWLFHEVSAFLF